MTGQRELPQHVGLQHAEPPAERDLVGRRQMLVAEHQHVMFEPGGVDAPWKSPDDSGLDRSMPSTSAPSAWDSGRTRKSWSHDPAGSGRSAGAATVAVCSHDGTVRDGPAAGPCRPLERPLDATSLGARGQRPNQQEFMCISGPQRCGRRGRCRSPRRDRPGDVLLGPVSWPHRCQARTRFSGGRTGRCARSSGSSARSRRSTSSSPAAKPVSCVRIC